MGIGGEAAVFAEFAAEVFDVFSGDSSFEKGAGVDAGGGVSLEVYLVGSVFVFGAFEEVVEGDFVEGRRGGVGGDVASDAVFFAVGADDHCHGVPADDAFDAAFEFAAAGVGGLGFDGDGVDVGRIR